MSIIKDNKEEILRQISRETCAVITHLYDGAKFHRVIVAGNKKGIECFMIQFKGGKNKNGKTH